MSPPRSPAPWPTLSEAPQLDFSIFRLRQKTVQHPTTGRAHPRVVIDGPDWVNVIPVTAAGAVVLVRQYRFGTASVTLEIPGGMVDPGEAPAEAALRELEEETGYRADRLVPLGWSHPNPALQSNRLHSYLALGCHRVHEGHADPGEELTVEEVPRAALPGLVLAGEISHALVLVALYLEQLQPR
jgi:8-oxo-dGTP pyrophosphatase MutT (NUDIX family)